MPAAIAFPRAWFALNEDGTFHETKLGTAGFEDLIGLLLSGEFVDVVGVYEARGGLFVDETHAAVSEVFRRWMKASEEFVPDFLKRHAEADVDRQLGLVKTAAEHRADPDTIHDRQHEDLAA